jgi:biopolymer transport protein ExbD
MKRRRYTLEEQGFSEINITPFTDVVLVLLIIFMITSPFLISGAFQVKLPKAASAETSVSKGVEVYLTDQNEIVIDSKKITQEELIAHLKAAFVKEQTNDVVVKADKNVIHGNFIHLLDLLKTSGAQKILIATTKVASENQAQ